MTTNEFTKEALWSKGLFKEMEKHVLSELSLFSYNKKILHFMKGFGLCLSQSTSCLG
jgi:hypothetical protein